MVNLFSGSQTNKSALYPFAIFPLLSCLPNNIAGFLHNHFAISFKLQPCFFAADHKTGNANCKDEIPPQAFVKFPLCISLSSGGAGEWSVATKSIIPSFNACHS